MAKNNNEALKKHHFWILAGLAPLLVLVAVIMMMSGVGSAISAKQAEISKSIDEVTKASPPGKGTIEDLGKQKDILNKKKGELWKENWDRQNKYFSWPRGPRGEFDKYVSAKFGDNLRQETNEFEVFTKNYHDMFREMADRVRPTKFAGGWQSVLRYVTDWGQMTPKSEQLWIALEDVWVQRAILEPIRQVNDQTAAFEMLPDPQSTPLKRKFRSRIWDLSLEVVDQGPNKVLKGRLKNRTPQIQLLGNGNTMRLNVWFDAQPNAPGFPFDVQGEFIPGDAEVEIPPLFTHTLPPGSAPVEIVRVRQEFDDRTVPVRRIDRIAIGYKSSRDATTELKAPEFWKDDAAPAGSGSTSPGMDTMAGRPTPGGAGGPGGPGGPGMPGMSSGAGTGGSPAAVLDANRKRYLEWTDQVRRMPIAFVVVTDQMFIPDVLVAYSNSDFRFYTVQYHWKRFHGSLSTATTGGGSGAGSIPGGFTTPGDEGASVGGLVGNQLLGGGFGPGMPGMPGMPGGFGGFGGASSNNISEAQANAGLVELTVYGTISIYQKYDEKKDGAAAETPATPEPDKTTDASKAGDTKAPDAATKPAPGDTKAPDAPAKPAPGDAKPQDTPMPKGGGDTKAPDAPAKPVTPPGDTKTTPPANPMTPPGTEKPKGKN